jgi:hypothetical protein
LVIDETGDRKDGKKTAHVGKQYLGGIGKIDNGVVSVSSLWADERIYYPLEVEPYNPAHHFEGGKDDPAFRTKPRIALELVEAALEAGLPCRSGRWWLTSSTGSTGGSGEHWRRKKCPTCWRWGPPTPGGTGQESPVRWRRWLGRRPGAGPTSPGSSHDQGRIVRLGSGFWLRFGPLGVFRYEFSGLIRTYGAVSLLDLLKTRSRMNIPVRVSRTDDTYAVPAGQIAPFTAQPDRF